MARGRRNSEEREGDQNLKLSFLAFAAGHIMRSRHRKGTGFGRIKSMMSV